MPLAAPPPYVGTDPNTLGGSPATKNTWSSKAGHTVELRYVYYPYSGSNRLYFWFKLNRKSTDQNFCIKWTVWSAKTGGNVISTNTVYCCGSNTGSCYTSTIGAGYLDLTITDKNGSIVVLSRYPM